VPENRASVRGLGAILIAVCVSGCLPPDVPLASLFQPGSVYGPPCLEFIAGYEIIGQIRDADTSEPLLNATVTLQVVPADPLWPSWLRRVVLTDEDGRFTSPARFSYDCEYPLEPTPFSDPPDEVELEIVTNEGTATVAVAVEADQVTPIDQSHGRIELSVVFATVEQ